MEKQDKHPSDFDLWTTQLQLKSKTIERLREEDLDNVDRLCALDRNDLRMLGLTLGEIMALMKGIEKLNADTLTKGFCVEKDETSPGKTESATANSEKELGRCQIDEQEKDPTYCSQIEIKDVKLRILATHNAITLSWDYPKERSCQKYQMRCIIDCQCEKTNPEILLETHETKGTFSGLTPATLYAVSINPILNSNDFSEKIQLTIKTKPTEPPGKPKIVQVSPKTFDIKWSCPNEKAVNVGDIKYKVKIHYNDKIEETAIDNCTYEGNYGQGQVHFFSNIPFVAQVIACCGENEQSLPSAKSDSYELIATPEDIMKLKLCENGQKLDDGPPAIYSLRLVSTPDDSNTKIKKYEVGNEAKVCTGGKVIMILGATGSGKTTLINGMVNYILGVEWEDPFRFKLIVEAGSTQAKSQTSSITSYTLHHMKGFRVHCTVTIIDTPGFGDTSGIMKDKEITEQIHSFFTSGGTAGIDHIDAVGFVAQSSLPRLTPTQRYVFEQVLALFGKDIAKNIFLLLTFADGQPPQVLSGIKQAGIEFETFYKFNSSALYIKNCTEEPDIGLNFDKVFWQMGISSCKQFFTDLIRVETKSLSLSQSVLSVRKRLELNVEHIQKAISMGLNTLERLQQEAALVMQHAAEVEACKDFEYTVREERAVMVAIEQSRFVTNCLPCKRTCHDNCAYENDDQKRFCYAMTDDHCRFCPKKCIWSVHKNFPYIFEIKFENVTKTAEDLRKRYEEADEKQVSAQKIIDKIVDEFEALQLEVLDMTEEVRKSILELQEIALRPNPLGTLDYIDILIESEKFEASPGWSGRVKQMQKIRGEVAFMKDIAEKGGDPLKKYKEKVALEKEKKPDGPWARVDAILNKIKSWV